MFETRALHDASLEGASVMTTYSDVRIFLCLTPTDMHYAFDRLLRRTREIFEQDPWQEHIC
jgi:hypothetical protein